MRGFFRYTGIFAGTLIVCIALLLGVCAFIPQSSIRQNCLEADAYFSASEGFPLLIEGNPASRMDNYADIALLDVIYNVDAEKPVYSMITAPYYRIEGRDIREDYHSAVAQGLAPNNQYARYWHGMQIFLRPLLLFTSVTGCRLALFFLLLALHAVLIAQLVHLKAFRALIVYLLALIAVQFWMCAFTLEYVSVFLVTAAACIAVAASFYHAPSPETLDRRMTIICIVSGTLTCFLDFLTAETLTFTVPVLLFLMLCKERRLSPLSLRRIILLLMRWGLAWLAAYAGAFAVKWLLVLLTMGKEAFLGVFTSASLRIDRAIVSGDGLSGTTVFSSRLPMMLARNLVCLFPVSDGASVPLVLWSAIGILAVLGAIFYLFRSQRMDATFVTVALLLGLIPYLRFFVLSSHAHDHYFFTYRAQMASIMALLAVMAYSLNPAEVLHSGKKKRKKRR